MSFPRAAGDINPFDADMFRYATPAETFAQVDLVGHVLAQKVLEASRSTQFTIGSERLSFRQNFIDLVERSDGSNPTPSRRAEVDTLVIGTNFAFAAIPGEPFVELGWILRDGAHWPPHGS